MNDDPFEQMRALQDRVAKLADDMGLDLAALEFVPHAEYGNLVHFIVQVRQETLKTNEEIESDAVRSQFESLMSGFEVAEGEDGQVTLAEHKVIEVEEPEDPALEEAEAKIQEKARERARRRLTEPKDEGE